MAVTAQWSSRFGFLMAAIGFAVGLGNIWRFPYVTGENGGGAFVLVYLFCAVLIGVPILIAEVMLGRRGGSTPPTSMALVAQGSQRSRHWAMVGYVNLAAAFLIVIGYAVVAGWVFAYLVSALGGQLTDIDPLGSTARFEQLLAAPARMLGWTALAVGLTCLIIYNGVQKGIERVVVLLMPLLFTLLLGLVVYNAFAGGMQEALAYLFLPDFSKLNGEVFLAALGQAFFSIGVAMAGMMMFGAYLPHSVSIGKSAMIIVFADTLVALVAGLVIFPMVFANHLDPSGGPGLIFQTLPVAFVGLPGGEVVGVLFFLLLSVAAVTSLVGLCEPLCSWLSEYFRWTRQRAAFVLGITALLASCLSIASYNVWAHVGFFGTSLGAILDYVPNQILLPLGGLLIACFAGWRMLPHEASAALALAPTAFRLWHGTLRYFALPAVALILLNGLWG